MTHIMKWTGTGLYKGTDRIVTSYRLDSFLNELSIKRFEDYEVSTEDNKGILLIIHDYTNLNRFNVVTTAGFNGRGLICKIEFESLFGNADKIWIKKL